MTIEPEAWVDEPTGYPETSRHYVDPEGWWEVYVKWDGCMDWTRYYNVPKHMRTGSPEHAHVELEDSFHLCGTDDMIALLESVRARASRDMGPWPR